MTRFKAELIEKHIRRKHPGCPDFAVAFFVGEIVKKDWKGATIGKAVGITMQTTLRHIMTDYDQMLLVGVDREEARRRVQPKVNAMISKWKKVLVARPVSDKADPRAFAERLLTEDATIMKRLID